MSDESPIPVDVSRIECAPLGRGRIAVRITGRWTGRRISDARAFLLVEAEGRRHRFPALPGARRPRLGRLGAWTASFALPSWLEPHLGQELALWLGTVEIPLPTVSFVAELPEIGTAVPPPAGANGVGPASEAQLRAALAGSASLRAQLEHAAREAVHLRDELVQLRSVTEQEGAERALLEARNRELSGQLAALRTELAQSDVARVAALSEAAGLRADLERLRAELAHARGTNNVDDGLSEARSLLVEARAVTARLREASSREH